MSHHPSPDGRRKFLSRPISASLFPQLTTTGHYPTAIVLASAGQQSGQKNYYRSNYGIRFHPQNIHQARRTFEIKQLVAIRLTYCGFCRLLVYTRPAPTSAQSTPVPPHTGKSMVFFIENSHFFRCFLTYLHPRTMLNPPWPQGNCKIVIAVRL